MIVVVLFKNTVLFHAFKKVFKIRPAKHCKWLKKSNVKILPERILNVTSI